MTARPAGGPDAASRPGAAAAAPAPAAPDGAAAAATAPATAPPSGTGTAAGQAVTVRPGRRGARRAGPARPALSTPAGLKRLGALSLLLGTLTGVSGYALVQSDAAEIERTASAQAATLNALSGNVAALPEQARTAVAAGANATDAAALDATIAALARRLPEAAAAQPLDATQLGHINAALNRYALTVQTVRARSAAGGSDAAAQATLQRAQTQLTSDVGAPLGELAASQTSRAESARSGRLLVGGLFGASTLATLATMVAGAAWMAKRTHRAVNVPLTAGVLVTLGVAALAVASVGTVPAVSGAAASVLTVAANSPLGGPLALLGGVTAGALVRAGTRRRLREYS